MSEPDARAAGGELAEARAALRTVFGFEDFREPQGAIVERLLRGGDALVLMPTGGGKSLCYQLPALLRDGTGVVVSPLIALMEDQVRALGQAGVRAQALNSTLGAEAAARVERALVDGDLDLLYVAPERLLKARTLDLLSRARLALFAIDEAHCVSQWGHDFRPEYLELAVLAERFPGVPRVALTATADAATRREIRERLALDGAEVFVSGFDRPNIRYHVTQKTSPRSQLLDFLTRNHRDEAGIVYCLSRRKVDETAEWLRARGFDALPYHAGLPDAERKRHQGRFVNEEGVIIVATIAFGMGIDKPNVRFVAHLDLPKSLEAYYQETGRCGRDGLPADAWMVYGLQDVIGLRQMVEGSALADDRKRVERQKLETMLGYCEVTGCRRQALLNYFGETLAEPCGNCDNCLAPVASYDGTEVAQKAMSCVYRTGQRFGVSYLVDVLTGKESDRIRRFGHDRVSTFGIGTELDATEWRSVFRQLVARGLVAVDIEGHGGLRLTPSSRAVLRGEERLALRRDAARRRPASAPAPRRDRTLDPEHRALFDALRERRLALAREQGVPPYVIFHDSTLAQIAATRPTSREALAGITGVGTRKLDRYGEELLGIVREHAGKDR